MYKKERDLELMYDFTIEKANLSKKSSNKSSMRKRKVFKDGGQKKVEYDNYNSVKYHMHEPIEEKPF
jgi:hypothetical protein